jgi:hypothetical protein
MSIIKLPLELSFGILDNLNYKCLGLLLLTNKKINKLIQKYFICLNEKILKKTSDVKKNVLKVFYLLILEKIQLSLDMIKLNLRTDFAAYNTLFMYNIYIIPNWYLLKLFSDERLIKLFHERLDVMIIELKEGILSEFISLHEILFIKREFMKIKYILNKCKT